MSRKQAVNSDPRMFGLGEDPSLFGTPEVRIMGDILPTVLTVPGLEGGINVDFALKDVIKALEQTQGGNFFADITDVIVGPMSEWGHVESRHPHTIHLNEQGILDVIETTVANEANRAKAQGIEPSVTPDVEKRVKFEIAKKLAAVLGHERAHAEDFQGELWKIITTGKGSMASVPEAHGPAAEPAAERGIERSPFGRGFASKERTMKVTTAQMESWVSVNCNFALMQKAYKAAEAVHRAFASARKMAKKAAGELMPRPGAEKAPSFVGKDLGQALRGPQPTPQDVVKRLKEDPSWTEFVTSMTGVINKIKAKKALTPGGKISEPDARLLDPEIQHISTLLDPIRRAIKANAEQSGIDLMDVWDELFKDPKLRLFKEYLASGKYKQPSAMAVPIA